MAIFRLTIKLIMVIVISTLIYKLRIKMKKLISIISLLFFVTTFSAKAEMGIGITAAAHMFDGSGSETMRQSAEVKNGSLDETVVIPEVFVEAIDDNGLTVGLSYVPVRELGAKSRTDSNSEGTSGTYKADAELANVVQLYADIPTGTLGSFPIHTKLGIQRVTVDTLESLNSGSEYPNRDLMGFTVGLGTKGDLPFGNNLYYKGEFTYTNFETYEAVSTAGNKVVADLEDYAAKLSIGYKF